VTTPRTIGEIDLLTDARLAELAHHRGPAHVSLFMPAHRAGPDTRQDPIRFRNLLGRAGALLTEQAGMTTREADELLAGARELVDDERFWQHQADGLALYVAPGLVRTVRVPLALAEDVAVGRRFRLRPLLPLLADDGHFFVLALSKNEVRLYEGTRFTIAELDPRPMPASMAEALAHEDPEAQLQVRAGGEAGMFHGHGEGAEVDKQALERYFRAVDRGLLDRIGGRRRTPLVLAAVAYYLPMYAGVSGHPALVEPAVEGNPENRSPQDLHAAAWDIVAPRFEATRRIAVEAFHGAEGRGATSTDVATVVRRPGRVGSRRRRPATDRGHARHAPARRRRPPRPRRHRDPPHRGRRLHRRRPAVHGRVARRRTVPVVTSRATRLVDAAAVAEREVERGHLGVARDAVLTVTVRSRRRVIWARSESSRWLPVVVRAANMCSWPGRRSCTPISTRSTHRSSNATTPACDTAP
jgi:hypothetical protein